MGHVAKMMGAILGMDAVFTNTNRLPNVTQIESASPACNFGVHETGILSPSPEMIAHFQCGFFRQVCFEVILANMSGFVWEIDFVWCFLYT